MKLKGAMLRDARERKGLTQEALATALEMSRATVSNAENEDDIWVSTGIRLCEFLDLDLAQTVLPRIPVTTGNGDVA
jgi:transcriptional regulator with XRE-family HTH domain